MTNFHNIDFNKMKLTIMGLSKPKPAIYWIDLSISAIFGWSFFVLSFEFERIIGLYSIFLFLSAIGLYRTIAFTHELVHLKKDAIPYFNIVWHIVGGIPLLAPHFLYREIHITHHSKHNYGKESDGEYIEFGTKSRFLIFAHLLFNFIIPIFSIFRFMVIAPLSFFHPKWRIFVMTKLSFMGLRFSFDRKLPKQKSEIINWLIEEVTCCLSSWGIIFLITTAFLPIRFLFQWYVVLVIILTMNSLRAIGATHWYKSNGTESTFVEQIKDSINITSSSLFTQILCPVGTQYHSLHHIYPFIPYHSLGKVYRHLLQNFPDEKILLSTSDTSLFKVWKKVLSMPRNRHDDKLIKNQFILEQKNNNCN